MMMMMTFGIPFASYLEMVGVNLIWNNSLDRRGNGMLFSTLAAVVLSAMTRLTMMKIGLS